MVNLLNRVLLEVCIYRGGEMVFGGMDGNWQVGGCLFTSRLVVLLVQLYHFLFG